jgi:NAD(P)-dependent dehydrogenase (short-subunit alcohol dehydrogenase family)
MLRLAGERAHVVINARANRQEAESVAREARNLGVKAVAVLADVAKRPRSMRWPRKRCPSSAESTS